MSGVAEKEGEEVDGGGEGGANVVEQLLDELESQLDAAASQRHDITKVPNWRSTCASKVSAPYPSIE